MRRKIGLFAATLFTFLLAFPAIAAEPPLTITKTKIDTYDGFDYELWSEKYRDPVTMTLTGGGTFECAWEAQNALFRTGKKLGSTMNYKEYGDVIMEYGAEHIITKGSVNYLTVYGWTLDPMVEFYIVENYGSYKPPGGVGFKGTIEVDGGTYEVYEATRVDKPSIKGNATFQQYFSVRVDKRTEGTITISDHFKAWEELGLDMSGNMYEVALCVEGYQSAGAARVYSHQLTIGDTVYGSVSAKPTDTFVPPALEPAATPTPAPAATATPAEASTPAAPTEPKQPSVSNPKTGAETYFYIALGALALGTAGAYAFTRRSRKT